MNITHDSYLSPGLVRFACGTPPLGQIDSIGGIVQMEENDA